MLYMVSLHIAGVTMRKSEEQRWMIVIEEKPNFIKIKGMLLQSICEGKHDKILFHEKIILILWESFNMLSQLLASSFCI